MSSYDVKITCLGHTFNVKGVKAHNREDAEQKALKMVKSKTVVAGSIENIDPMIDFFKKFWG